MSIFDKIRDKLLRDKSGEEVKIENPADQTQEDQELAGYIKKKIEEVRSQANRITHEGIWMTNIAYLLGFDSVYYDPQLKQFRPIDRSPQSIKRNRIHSNLLLPGVQNRLARMLKSPPKYDVRPNSLDEEDKDAARLGIEAIGMIWDKQHVNRKRIDLGMWKQQCGHSYLKVCWDDELGDPLVDPGSEEVLGNEGDIRIDVVSPFEVFTDPLAKTVDDAQWIAQAKVRKLDYFRTHYPERGAAVKEEGAWLLSAQYEMRLNTLNSIGPASSGTMEQMKNSAIEISYYEKKSKLHRKGRHIVCANGILLKNDDLPVGMIPLVKFDDVVVAGKYFSESLITHARPLQDQYNRTLLKRAQWVNKLLAGKYIAARGHGLMQEAMNDQSGEVTEYDPVPNAPEPHAMQLPVIPAYAYQETKEIKQEIYDLLGLSEVSRGQLPSASIPAMGLQILLEQDETRLSVETEQDEHSYATVGQLILKFIDEYYVTDRKLKTKGKNLEYMVKTINGVMLKKNFDVTVIRGSTIPNVKVMQRQEIMNAYTTGLLGNPQDPAVKENVLGKMEFGEIGEVWEDYHLDMSQIQKTIKQIEEGLTPLVGKLDNHAMHIMVKNRYRKSDKYDALSPDSKRILEADINAHAMQGAILQNPALGRPPDNGPPPEAMLEMLKGQAKGLGLANNSMPIQNSNNQGAPNVPTQ